MIVVMRRERQRGNKGGRGAGRDEDWKRIIEEKDYDRSDGEDEADEAER